MASVHVEMTVEDNGKCTYKITSEKMPIVIKGSEVSVYAAADEVARLITAARDIEKKGGA